MEASSSGRFLDQYTIYRKNENSDDTVLRDKASGNFVLMKELIMPSSEEFKKIVETLEAQRCLRHQHLLTLLDYYTMGEVAEDHSVHRKVVTFFEYATHNLLEEIEVRYSENRLFEQAEVWSILCSSVLGLAYLQKESVGHGCVSPIDIFIASDGTVRVVDPSIATSSPFILQEGYYYSPQIMEYFRSPQEVSTEDLDIFRSDVFSLGMCVLHAALLESANDCFDYENCEVDYEQINSKLALFAEHYPPELSELLSSMLSQAPTSRPDFIDLEEQLMQMTHSQQSATKKSIGGLFEAAFSVSALCQTLPRDTEDPSSLQEGCPMIDAVDTWAIDFNEDGAQKDQSISGLFASYSHGLEEISAAMPPPAHRPAPTDYKPEYPHRNVPVIENPLPLVNSSFAHQATPPPSIHPPQLLAGTISSFHANASATKETPPIAPVPARQESGKAVTERKPLADCTPDKNTTTVANVQSSSKAFSQQSQSRSEVKLPEVSIRVSSANQPLDQPPQQLQLIPFQFRPPTNRTLQLSGHPQLQPTLVQQTLTRVVEIQQVPVAQPAPLYHPQVVRTSHHIQQRPNELMISGTPTPIKPIVQGRQGVSPRNYLGYRPVGCNDQHLFTDPALLNMMRQDMQRILSKSQLKSRDN